MAKKPVKADFLAQSACGNCKHWRRLDDSEQLPREDVLGECLRYPPAVVGLEEGSGEAIQIMPVVEARHYCGEHGYRVN